MTPRVAAPLLIASVALSAGCYSGPMGHIRDRIFPPPDRTTMVTPPKRIEEVQALAERSTGENTPDQLELTTQLARKIQIEPDPIVRRQIVIAAAKFRTPLADQMLQAGLADTDPAVRAACCEGLAGRGEGAVAALSKTIRTEKNFDVRVAAVRALGEERTASVGKALMPALEDRDPAMQYVAMQAMQSATGQDLGNDVNAYIAAAQGAPQAVADRSGSWGRWGRLNLTGAGGSDDPAPPAEKLTR